ncbi:Hint domain-containing protein, partial [Cerasicoccus arenae]
IRKSPLTPNHYQEERPMVTIGSQEGWRPDAYELATELAIPIDEAAALNKFNKAKKVVPDGCFIAGTLVSTPDGFVEIQDLESGDLVYAYNFETGEVVEREVLETINNFTYYWIDVEIAAGTIVATRFHCFWVESENDWLYAIDLKPGMVVRLADGGLAEIEGTTMHELSQPEDTFNLEVAVDHNYFVGINSILVHNGDENGNSKKSEKPQHRYVIRDTQVQNPAGGSDAVKTGVSGTELNQNGTSGQANRQVNQFNKQEGVGRFQAEVVEKNVTGSDGQTSREKILASEQKAATELKEEGNSMSKHVRPKPGC